MRFDLVLGQEPESRNNDNTKGDKMKICVCFKIVPDLDQVLESDWRDLSQGLDTSYVKKMINCFDETALEMALRLKETAADTGAACTAVTVGGGLASLMKGLYAVGYDRVVNIPLEHREFCPETVAALLADFIKSGDFDLVLFGKQAGMADSGMVPPLSAELLGLPFVGDTVAASLEGGQLVLEHETPEGLEVLKLKGPVAASVGDAEYAYLRVATLREKMAASKRDIEEWPALPAEDTVLPAFSRESSAKECVMIEGESGAVKAGVVYKKWIEGMIS